MYHTCHSPKNSRLRLGEAALGIFSNSEIRRSGFSSLAMEASISARSSSLWAAVMVLEEEEDFKTKGESLVVRAPGKNPAQVDKVSVSHKNARKHSPRLVSFAFTVNCNKRACEANVCSESRYLQGSGSSSG